MTALTTRDGVALEFDTSGAGTPVVLVDGALCSRQFGPTPKLLPRLVDHSTVIRYDRRGRGGSSDSAEYSVEREIDDLATVLDMVGEPATVVGFSSGAILALRAASVGVPMRGLIAWEPPLVTPDTGGHPPPADADRHLSALISAGRRDAAVKYFFTQVMGAPRVLYYLMRLAPFWPHLRSVAPSLPYDAAVLLRGLDAPEEWLPRVPTPTLVLSGAKSTPALRKAASATSAALPIAAHHELAKTSHNVPASVLAPAILSYLRSGLAATNASL